MNKAIHRKSKAPSRLAGGAAALAGATLAAAGGWIVYSHLAIDHQLPLPDAIPASKRSFYTASTGRVNYYYDTSGAGRPLVLLHSINAAASAYEMRPLFEHYRSSRPVYAIDWPGYGFSERTDREYTPKVFDDALVTLLADQVGEPADVVALSLGSEFAVRAALVRPELFHSLALISPSGFNAEDTGRASQKAGKSGAGGSAYSVLSVPLWSRALFDLIATRRSIEYFLQQSFAGPLDQGMVNYAYLTSHQPGAHYVPLYFLSGMLFTPNIRQEVYEKIQLPSLVIYDRDPFVNFERLPNLLAAKRNWRASRIIPSRGLPQFEKLMETVSALDFFWHGVDNPASDQTRPGEA